MVCRARQPRFNWARSKTCTPNRTQQPLLLVEIPADFLALKTASQTLALEWRLHTRDLFEALFERGYLVTDFVHLPGTYARSFYVLSYGEAKV